ncbi:cysteine peptidase family C39 domain-containing protein, partial [Chryseobacterium sp. HMWF001]
SEIKDTVTDLAEKGIEFLKILNAFNCGVINGLVGLVQCILYILEFLLQPTTTFSYQQYLERRDLLEKAEDVLDWAHENVPVFLEGVKNLFSSSGGISQADFEGIFDELKGYWDNASRYTIAFYTGVIAFEFIINILLLIFTEGAGNIIKGATYVEKASSLLWVLTRETFSAVTFGITDLLLGLGKLIFRFAKACAKGFKGFIKFVEELLQGAKSGAKAENLAEEAHDIEEVVLKGQKPLSIYKIPTSVIRGLQSVGIEIIGRAKDYLLKWKNKKIFIGDWEEVTNFWRKILKPKLGTGTGGTLKYLEVLSRNMVDQEHSMSCAAACIRQLAKDNGIEMTEASIRELAGTTKLFGTTDLGIELALRDIFKDKEIEALTYREYPDEEMHEIITQISERGSWIGSIHPMGGKKHAVIIDKVLDSKVYIKDPWPLEGIGNGSGVEAIVDLEEFSKLWLRGGANKFNIK